MKKNLLLVFALFNIVFTNAKAQNIDSLKIIPSNPTDVDNIEVICYSTFPNILTLLLSSNVIHTSPFSIYVGGDYTMGMLPQPFYSVDTITIGFLSVGTYVLTYELLIGGTSYDTDSISFTVSSITGITDINKANNFNIYPNPVTDFLIIENKESTLQKVLITDLIGRTVMEFTIQDQKHMQNLGKLSEGTYFVHLISKNNYIESKKIIKLKE